jgi:hypothetical protein
MNNNYNYGYYDYDATLKYANVYIRDGDTFTFNYREEDIIQNYKPILGDEYPEYIDINTYIDYLNYGDFIYRKVNKISKNAQFLPEKFIITGDMNVKYLF